MAAFPYTSSSELKILETQAEAILGAFRARGYVCEEPSVLQPADIFLDRSGEEIRRRTFTLTEDVDREKITARIKAGQVRITLPKAAKAQPRRIAVETAI